MAKRSELSNLLVDIGARIAAARGAAQLTQEAAAAQAGIDYKRWQQLEAGRANVTIKTLCRVAVALGASWETIAVGERGGPRKVGVRAPKR